MLDKGLFPLNSDTQSNANQYVPDLNRAQIRIRMYKGGYTKEQISDVKMDLYLSSNPYAVAFTEYYLLDDKRDDLKDPDYFWATFKIDSTIFAHNFPYDKNAKRINLVFTPFGGAVDAESVSGKTLSLIPMWNGKNISDTGFCSNGFYGISPTLDRVVAFAQSELIETMKSLSDVSGMAFRCNDMSLPFGSNYFIKEETASDPILGKRPRWSHLSHDNGRIADLRYFNSSAAAQDAYDIYSSTSPQMRLLDVRKYLTFSETATKIALASEATDTEGYWAAKTAIRDHCLKTENHSVSPCDSINSEVDLDFEKVLKICQIFEDAPNVPIVGCDHDGADYLTAIKKFSNWVQLNSSNFSTITRNYSLYMSSGDSSVLVGDIKTDWQADALDRGIWPDGQWIYTVNAFTNALEATPMRPCFDLNGCGMKHIFYPVNDHLNHFHFRVGPK